MSLSATAHRRRGVENIHKDAARWSELLFRCEMAKRQLIADTVVPFAMREAYIEHGPPHSIDFMLERAWVEARWVPCSVPMFHRTVASVVPDPRVLLAPRADVAMALGAVLLTAGFGTEHRVVPGLGPGPV